MNKRSRAIVFEAHDPSWGNDEWSTMNESDRRTRDGDSTAEGNGPVRVRCTTDTVSRDLDVDWTKGAIFEFESTDAAERWVSAQSSTVPGTFYLADARPEQAALSVTYHVKYTAPEG